MKIAVIGTGYVGLVSGACFSEFGFDVVCVDQDAGKIEQLKAGKIPIYEPELDTLVKRNTERGRLSFTTDLPEAMVGAGAVFIAVGTPSRRGDGHADLSYVYAAAETIAKEIKDYTVVVTKSTVPVGTGRKVAEIIRKANPAAKFDMASNPEFLREGSAIGDFMRPDRVVIGCETEEARAVMRQLYRPLFLIETPILFTSLETSELIKYASNAFLALKISFINQISDLCDQVGANVTDVSRGIGLDGRIGSKFLHPGPGYGGSCFPKDTLALMKTARDAHAPISLVEATVSYNDARKVQMADRISTALNGDVKGKTVAVLGLTFKPNTDDMRDAPSLVIIPELLKRGAKIQAHDPVGTEEARKHMPDIDYCEDPYQTMVGADALVIVTEWNSYRALDLAKVKKLLKAPIVIDLRNIYRPDEMAQFGFNYTSLGRPRTI
ncbi:UDP-glucose dehydrogenase family protein [Dongia rigui]|uniref:UDP-glucose 6-dehydrogenase n=1 Tax=Dongia rigui TaxID=940149 RepID=A0ABU5DZA7_9PROT|nr:UDP-glucose/GDP-mannose dehydrogenase family protein [Dongia rigui]MDY0872578.1 UDP-glucose/GDP-mannose dehydrogenase family protein [Dongia rigui]